LQNVTAVRAARPQADLPRATHSPREAALPTELPKRDPHAKRALGTWKPEDLDALLGGLIAVTVLVMLVTALPQPLVLPAFGIIAYLAGIGLGLRAIFNRRCSQPARLRSRDIAGLMVLIGCGAFIMADIPAATEALEALQRSMAAQIHSAS
jgi:hypothetical protein